MERPVIDCFDDKTYQTYIDALNEYIDELENSIYQQNSRIEDLENALYDKDIDISELHDRINYLKEEIGELS